jgi:hypothetical protein
MVSVEGRQRFVVALVMVAVALGVPRAARAEPSSDAHRSPSGAGFNVSVAGGASRGLGEEERAATTLDADVVIARPSSRWRLSPSLGLRIMPAQSAGRLDEVSFTALFARALAGARWGPLDVLGGPFASRYEIGGATTHSGFLFGAQALLRVSAPISRALRFLVEGRADGYANRVRVTWADGRAYATPRVGLGVGLGLAWEWPSSPP